MKVTEQQIRDQIDSIEMAMACDDQISHYGFSWGEAEERLLLLKKLLVKILEARVKHFSL